MPRPTHLRRRVFDGRFLGEDAVLRRPGDGSRDDCGRWVPSAPTETDIRATTAPSGTKIGGGRKRILESEGVRLEAVRMFWTATEVRASTPDTAGDLIVYMGEVWQATHVKRWSDLHFAVETVWHGNDD